MWEKRPSRYCGTHIWFVRKDRVQGRAVGPDCYGHRMYRRQRPAQTRGSVEWNALLLLQSTHSWLLSARNHVFSSSELFFCGNQRLDFTALSPNDVKEYRCLFTFGTSVKHVWVMLDFTSPHSFSSIKYLKLIQRGNNLNIPHDTCKTNSCFCKWFHG